MKERLHIWLCLFFLLLSPPLVAQQNLKFRVVEFQEVLHDMTAVEHEKLDANGDRYAVIKVSSTNPDDELRDYFFNFGYLNHITEVKNNQIWLYVQRNAKRVTIQRNGYKTVSDYDLKTTLMPGKTYSMKLSSEVKKKQRQKVRFVIEPKGVQAVVCLRRDSKQGQEELFGIVDSNTGYVENVLEYGSYYYSVLSMDYFNSEGMLTINESNKEYIENVQLQGKFSTITLFVNQDADIYVDDIKKGTRQWTGNLKEGSYVVECRRKNYKSSMQYIKVKAGESNSFELIPPTPITGMLSLISNPLDATIIIDGKEYGKTPHVVSELPIGMHTLTLSKAGYQDVTKQIEVSEGQTTELNYTLQTELQQGDKTQNSRKSGDGSPKIRTFEVANNGKSVSFKMIRIDAGTFEMGSNQKADEQPKHNVTISEFFYMGQTEVTQELWEAVMGNNPSSYKSDKNPVEKVSWDDCKVFIAKLNVLTGQQFRLPTEAEWEYAALPKKKERKYVFSGGNEIDELAWYKGNSNKKTHPVATKKPNDWGLYDMSGNVWEWVEDWYDGEYYANSPSTNPKGPATGSYPVNRGGSFFSNPSGCRAAYRNYCAPSRCGNDLGLRLAL